MAKTAKPGPGRPRVPDAERRTVVSLRMHPATLAALDAMAEVAGETRSATVERLVEEAVARGGES